VAVGGIVALSKRDSSPSDATPASASPPGYPGGEDGRFGGRGFPGGMGARGEITAIDGDSFTVQATDRSGDSSTVTVKTDDSTVYRDQVSGKVSDLRAGDTVLVAGTEKSGSIAATTIREGDGAGGGFGRRQGDQPTPPEGGQFDGGQGGPPDADGRGFAAGTITKVDGGTLTVKTMAGDTVKVTTSGDTDVVTTEAIGLSDLAKGDTVRVVGETDGDTVTARSVVRGDADLGFGPGGPGGRPAGSAT